MYAEVAVPLHLAQTFTYQIPEGLRATPGVRVVVPFGKKLLTGYVVAVMHQLPPLLPGVEVRPIREVLDPEPLLSNGMLALTRWVAEYYCAPWGETIRSALPAGSSASTDLAIEITGAGRRAAERHSPERLKMSTRAIALARLSESGRMNLGDLEKHLGKAKARSLVKALASAGLITVREEITSTGIRPRMQKAVRLVVPEAGCGPESGAFNTRKLTPGQEAVVAYLKSIGGESARGELVERTGASPSSLRTLEKRGWIEIVERRVDRRPAHGLHIFPAIEFELTADQQRVLEPVIRQIDRGEYGAFLLHGVTGSGKTEIYIRAMRHTLDRGKSSLMLVPEIALTPVFSRRLASHFADEVAILHSSLSEGERYDEWNRIKQGGAHVVIGTRSAVFAPLDDLGLVVVDEEQESSYKQEESPRYNGRDTAVYRALQHGATIVLGSATPSLESFHNAHLGKYGYLQLPERIEGRRLAEVAIVDMRPYAGRRGRIEMFSDELLRGLMETHERGEQSILLLNRRGFAPAVLCRQCGNMLRCPNCDVSLTYHRVMERVICHYCNHQQAVPERCPKCQGEFIHFAGMGTEQVEERLRQTFPDMRIARLDRDTARRRGSYERILEKFAAGDTQALVGTQMVAKGHDFPNVTLVGVVSADAGLGMPDFRSAERTFQLLTQVAGRAGRGQLPGRVFIQSYYPDHYAIRFARGQDFEGFYQHEIQLRRTRHFPPFSTLIAALIAHKDINKARMLGGELVRLLRQQRIEGEEARILGPAPAPLGRLRNQYRFQILIKCGRRAPVREALLTVLDQMRQNRLDTYAIRIDVDPVDLM
ncbi:MAG: primosomal protein N' [Acidobacteria bacterium]|nr:primosomal protein N' [Acidobacteriota bacterium]